MSRKSVEYLADALSDLGVDCSELYNLVDENDRLHQALQTREGITSDFPLIDPNQFAVYLSTMKAGEVITEQMVERLNGYMEIITQQYEWPESREDIVSM